MNWITGSTRLLFFVLLTSLTLTGCSSCGKDKNNDTDDMGMNANNDGGDPDMDNNNGSDMPDNPDMDTPTTDEVVISCDQNAWTPPADGLCETVPGSGPAVLFQVGSVLTPDAVYQNGTVLVSGTGGDATISCVGCDCAAEAQGATTVTCAEGALSAALINPHDHITFSLSWPQDHGDERYEHRHDWRRGIRGHNEVSTNPGSDSSREGVLYGELRMLMGGATSIAGSGSASGLLRNLDRSDDLEGLTGVDVDYRTFPLGDSDATLLDGGCNYPNVDDATRAANAGIYLPHVAEGIDAEANNEFRCLSSSDGGAVDLIRQNTSIIHGIGLTVTDIAAVAADGAKLVWSPRSNIDLYGNTARVTTFKNFGVTIALGTDWSASGSMNVLRELKCADYLNSTHYNGAFTDRELYLMSTYNAAVSMGADSQIGAIGEGFVADLTLFDGSVGDNYRAVVDADAEHVHLVMRGGTPLYGDASIIEGLVPAGEIDGCEQLDVCGNPRRVCIERDAGITIDGLRAAVNQNAYPLYFCGEPEREPSCEPLREGEYTGVSGSDADGDGIDDAEDICPATFTPVRPMDEGQNDFDSDTIGDDCDQCPLSDDDMCAALDPDDRDADGVPNLMDNCPGVPNEDQANEDGDPYGDVCDPCLGVDNTDSLACPATIYEIRAGTFGVGDAVSLDEVIVTAASDSAFFIQVSPDASYYNGVAMSGLYVFGSAPTMPSVGDVISVDGRLDVFGDTLELINLSNLTITATGQPLPAHTEVTAAEVGTGGARAAELEGTLVRLRDVTVTDANPDSPDDFNEFEVDGALRVDDVLYLIEPDPAVNDEFAILQGPLTFSFGNSKLAPGGPGDVVTGPPSLDRLEPNPVFIRANTSGSTVPPLRVILTGPSLGSTVVGLVYTGNVSGPPEISIPDGQSEGEVMLTAIGTGAGTVQAGLDGNTSLVNVTVYDDTSTRGVASVTPAASTLSVNATATLTVALTVPAPGTGQTVALAYTGGLTGPASINLPADTLSATVNVTAGANPGAATVTASIGGSMQTANIDVIAGSPNCLIISEMIEGSGSNNKAFEVYNCAGSPLQLSEFGVCLISNANSTCTASAALPAQTLPVGDVFTICRTTSGSAGDPVDGIANNCDMTAGSVANFNGNDRVVVFLDVDGNDQFGAADEIIDSFGEPAVDPGSIWSNTTYRRCDFTPYDGTGAFDVATLYTSHPEDDASDFGTPPVEGCP